MTDFDADVVVTSSVVTSMVEVPVVTLPVVMPSVITALEVLISVTLMVFDGEVVNSTTGTVVGRCAIVETFIGSSVGNAAVVEIGGSSV